MALGTGLDADFSAGGDAVIGQTLPGIPKIHVGRPTVKAGETRVKVTPGAVEVVPGAVTFSHPAAVGTAIEISVNSNGEAIPDLAELLEDTAAAIRAKHGRLEVHARPEKLCSHCRDAMKG